MAKLNYGWRIARDRLTVTFSDGDRRRLAVVRRDPDDDKFLESAVAGRAQYLVTGDRDLRELGSFRGTTILSAGEFLERMNR